MCIANDEIRQKNVSLYKNGPTRPLFVYFQSFQTNCLIVELFPVERQQERSRIDIANLRWGQAKPTGNPTVHIWFFLKFQSYSCSFRRFWVKRAQKSFLGKKSWSKRLFNYAILILERPKKLNNHVCNYLVINK